MNASSYNSCISDYLTSIDYINQNYEFVMQLYQNILKKYPNSIYKENIIKRLNIINNLVEEEINL